MSDPESIEQAASKVPFVGWSHAAAKFREMAAKHAPGGKKSVLLLGPKGVGKKAMARAWQYAAGGDAKLPIIDLDSKDAVIKHPCVATSRRAVPRNTHGIQLYLGENYHSEQNGTSDDTLDEDVVEQFSLQFFLTPLRKRPADVLALLHYFNQYYLPTKSLRPYETISRKFLEEICCAGWGANALELLKFLIDSAENNIQGDSRLKKSAAPPM
jgi:DNA-binding NtrC family response regulator